MRPLGCMGSRRSHADSDTGAADTAATAREAASAEAAFTEAAFSPEAHLDHLLSAEIGKHLGWVFPTRERTFGRQTTINVVGGEGGYVEYF